MYTLLQKILKIYFECARKKSEIIFSIPLLMVNFRKLNWDWGKYFLNVFVIWILITVDRRYN